MLLGFDENGNAKEVRVTDEGALLVEGSGGGGGSTSTETTLRGSVETLETTATTISIGKKVTSIDIGNYSDEATITLGIGNKSIVIGPNIAANVPVNKNIPSISLTASAADTKAQVIIKGVENGSGGDDTPLIPITENITFRKFVKPQGNIVLQQNIMQYIDEFKDIDLSELSDGEELSKSFYSDIAFGDDEMEPEHDFQINGIEVTVAQNYDEQTGEYGDWQYSFSLGGYFTVPEEQYPPEYEGGHPMFKMAFTSSDGINFVPDFGISFFEDSETSAPIWVPQDYIESEVDINFSTVDGEWNDVISEFLFTDEVKGVE